LLGLEVLSVRRKIAAALFVRDILCRRIEFVYKIALLTNKIIIIIVRLPRLTLLCFESNPYPKKRNARLMNFYHRTNYGQNEPVNKAILILNEYGGLLGFRDDENRWVFRSGFSRALSGERFPLIL
jgi:hypothetical protein